MDKQRKAYYAYKIGRLSDRWNYQFLDYCSGHPRRLWGPLVARIVWWVIGTMNDVSRKLGWHTEMRWAQREPVYNRNRLELIIMALKQHCAPEQNWVLGRREIIFYTLKCVWCLIWNMQAKYDRPRYTDTFGEHSKNRWDRFAADPVTVAAFNSRQFHMQEYTAWEWQELRVGSSSIDWRYDIETDTNV